jgi:hypothetical protein
MGTTNSAMLQTLCKEPSNADLAKYGANCCDLGAMWCMLLPSNHCSTFQLHTLVHHDGGLHGVLLAAKLAIGMLENSGAKQRHEIRRVQFKIALSGRGKAHSGTREYENRCAYPTLRGLLIRQYGINMLAEMEAEARAQGMQKPAQAGSRKRDADHGWQNPALRDRLQRLWAEQDEHHETLKLYSVSASRQRL